MHAEERGCDRDGNLEMIAARNERAGRSVFVPDADDLGDDIRQHEHDQDIGEDPGSDHGDRAGQTHDHVALEREQQYQGHEQGNDRYDLQRRDDTRVEPTQPLLANADRACEITGSQGHAYIDQYRKGDRCPGDGDAGNAQEQACQGRVEDDHGQAVDRAHDQGVRHVSPCQVAPHQDHGSAGRNAQQDHAGAVLERGLWRDVFVENDAEKQPGKERHGERFDTPVGDQGRCNGPRGLARDHDPLEIDLHHDRIDHEEEAYSNGYGYFGDFQSTQGHAESGKQPAQKDTCDDAQKDPDGQIFFPYTEASFLFSAFHGNSS